MNTYKFSFSGRQSGALGIRYKINEEYQANSIGEALYMLWTDYEHIQHLKIKENGKNIPYEEVKDTEFINNGYKRKLNRK